ncbi:MAG: znuA [Rhodospirillaceae bacterium]|nr:MAG: znuA [Rhodospirillaceae bacterium]
MKGRQQADRLRLMKIRTSLHRWVCRLYPGVCAGLLVVSLPAVAAPRVVATILPLQALATGVMAGVGEPRLLVPGGASPHAYALRPSDARALDEAQVVVLIDPSFETFLARPLAALAGRAQVVRVAGIPRVRQRPVRAAGPWMVAGHGTEKRADDSAAAAPHHDTHPSHETGAFDPHLWLDPDNARHIVATLAAVLAEVDPADAALYHRNAEALDRELEKLDDRLRRDLAPVAERPFIVFHDAYQYLEARYGLNAVGAITVAPERPPGARHLAAVRERIRSGGVVCVFHEPQFPPRLVETIVAGTGVRVGVLDPLGEAGQYMAMMQTNARSLRACLAPEAGPVDTDAPG